MNEEDRIGEEFCKFYMAWMADTFQRLPAEIHLAFCREGEQERHVICQGRKTCWKDSRFTADDTGEKRRFCFTGKEAGTELALQSFLAFLIEEMEKRFEDLLHLDAIEEQIRVKGGAIRADNLTDALIGELLDREWLVRRYVKKLLGEKELPALELLVQISAQKYEQRITRTKIYFCPGEYQACKGDIRFDPDDMPAREDRGITLDNLRTIRKMMEMSGECHGLTACKREGIYYIEGVTREENESSLLCAEFTGHLRWALRQGKQIFFEYHEGKIRIPALEGSGQNSAWKRDLSALREFIPELKAGREALEGIEKIIEALREQPHGTSIVFMDEKTLEKEKKRLGEHKRLYRMDPFSILEHQEEILGISSIDGAILADAFGNCHAVGAILDGKSIVEGNPGRGARYNSLVNYVNGIYEELIEEGRKDAWCFAVIMSEDRIVNLGVPEKLRKRVE